MKRNVLVATTFLIALSACSKNTSEENFVPTPVAATSGIPSSGTLPPGHPAINNNQISSAAPESNNAQMETATVVSFILLPQFTYIEVSQNNQTRWLATLATEVKQGDVIQFDHGSTIENFKSKALNRTFPSITFVDRVSVIKK